MFLNFDVFTYLNVVERGVNYSHGGSAEVRGYSGVGSLFYHVGPEDGDCQG